MATQQQLDEAIAARHELMIGGAAVSIWSEGRRVEFTRAKLSDLDRYIASLRRELLGTRRRSRITYVVPD